jgi:hypothetical protein
MGLSLASVHRGVDTDGVVFVGYVVHFSRPGRTAEHS